MHEQIGHDNFLKCGLKGINELMRQFADKANRVAEKHVLVGRQADAARRGIKRGE